MKKYLVTITSGNDYHCSCCRSTHTFTEMYEKESPEELFESLAEQFIYLDKTTGDIRKVDIAIDEIYVIAEELVVPDIAAIANEKYKPKMDRISEEIKQKLNEELKRRELANKRDMYEKLKSEFEGKNIND